MMVARVLRMLTAALIISAAAAPVGAQDGRLVFVRGSYPNTELYTARPDGTDLQRLLELPGHQYYPRWSPDGRMVAFGSAHEGMHGLFVVNADGTGLRRVTNQSMTSTHGAWGITWSVDGTQLCYGQWITYSYAVIRQVALDGSGWRTVVDIGGESAWPDISQSNGRLVFSRQQGSWSPTEQIYVSAPSGIEPPFTPVFPDNGCARECRWSPAGDRIVLTHSPGGWAYERFDVFVINADGTGRIRLTNDGVQDANPCFSPDGGRIVWARANGAGSGDLWIMNSDGTDKRPISGLGQCDLPDWTPYDTRDTTCPTTEATTTPAPNAAGWHKTDALVELSATDEESGVAATYYSLDGGPTQTYYTPIPVMWDGDHTLCYWSVDNSGNVEAPQSLALRIDTSCPFTQAAVSPGPAPSGWHLDPVTLALSPTDDGSGIAASYYVIDEAEPQTYEGSISIPADGTHTVRFWSTDVAGNVEPEQTLVVQVDASTPSTSCIASPEPNSAGWNNTAVSLELTATDACSGVAATYYKVDGGSQQTYDTAIVVSDEGEHTVTFWSVDVAGNAEAPQSRTLKIDKTPPTIILTEPTSGAYVLNEVVNATYASVDELSGLRQCVGTVPSGSPIDTSAPGTRTCTVSAVDNAGNTSVATVTYTVSYRVVARYDQDKTHKSGSTVPIKVRIEDAAGCNVSAPEIPVQAVQVYWIDGSAAYDVEDAGNANPDGNFRYTDGMYVFNLSTKAFRAGTWELRLTVSGDPMTHAARFRVR